MNVKFLLGEITHRLDPEIGKILVMVWVLDTRTKTACSILAYDLPASDGWQIMEPKQMSNSRYFKSNLRFDGDDKTLVVNICHVVFCHSPLNVVAFYHSPGGCVQFYIKS